MDLVKATPAEGNLPRQTAESYILVDVDFEMELHHFKSMLFLSTVGGLDLSISQNAQSTVVALERAGELLSQAINEWNWLDREGTPYPDQPHNNPGAFDPLTMDEINWMIEAVSSLAKEDATSEGN